MTFWQWLISLFSKPKPDPTPVPAPVPGPSGMLDELNRVRVSHKLPPFVADAKLDALAQKWADNMNRVGVLFHGNFQSRIDSVYPEYSAAENIADGRDTAGETVSDWMDSPPHRANILGYYTGVGVGHGGAFWVVDFVRLVQK